MKALAGFMFASLLYCGVALGAIEELSFESEEQETRYHRLIDELRCPKCTAGNLSGSDAPIAADLRAEIHSQILEGRSDQEIIDFMTARYGFFILYRPPLHPATSLLWFGPLLLLGLGLFVARRLLKQQSSSATEQVLSADEQSRLSALLDDKDSRPS